MEAAATVAKHRRIAPQGLVTILPHEGTQFEDEDAYVTEPPSSSGNNNINYNHQRLAAGVRNTSSSSVDGFVSDVPTSSEGD